MTRSSEGRRAAAHGRSARAVRPAPLAARVAAAVAGAAWAACATPASRDPVAAFAAMDLRAFASAPTPHGVLVAGGRVAEQGVVALFDAAGTRLATAELGDDVVYAITANASGTHAAAALADGGVVLLPLPALAPAVRLWRHGRAAVAVAFSPDASREGTWLASAGLDGVARTGPIASASGGVPAPSDVVVLEHTAAATCVAWSADGALVASGARDGKVRVHDRTGRLLRSWQRLGGDVLDVAFTATGLRCHVRPSPLVPPQEHVLPFVPPA